MDETGAPIYLMHNALNELIAAVSEQATHYTPRICSSYGPQTEFVISSEQAGWELLLIFDHQ